MNVDYVAVARKMPQAIRRATAILEGTSESANVVSGEAGSFPFPSGRGSG